MIVRDMPKCIVSKRENCGYGGVTDRECVGEIGLLLGFFSSQCSLVLPWKVSLLHLRYRGCLEFFLTTSNFVNKAIVKINSYLSTAEALLV